MCRSYTSMCRILQNSDPTQSELSWGKHKDAVIHRLSTLFSQENSRNFARRNLNEKWQKQETKKQQLSYSPSIAPTTLLVSLDSWGDETKISKHAIDYKYTIYLDKVTEGYNNKADILNVQLFYLHLEEWTLAQWFVSCKTAFSQTEHFMPYFYMFSSFKKRKNQVLRCFTSLGWGMFDSL